MRLVRILLHDFSKPAKDVYSLNVPKKSKVLDAVLSSAGIHLYYSMPDGHAVEHISNFKVDNFVILNSSDNKIPDDSIFIRVLEGVVDEGNGTPIHVAYPIFRITNPSVTKLSEIKP